MWIGENNKFCSLAFRFCHIWSEVRRLTEAFREDLLGWGAGGGVEREGLQRMSLGWILNVIVSRFEEEAMS